MVFTAMLWQIMHMETKYSARSNMGTHKSSNHEARKKKYTAQFARTEANKKRNIEKLKAANPNWPDKKGKQ